MNDCRIRVETELFDAFVSLTLPKPEWTHAAHLAVCRETVNRMDADVALPFLRTSVRRYNEATGVANTPNSGYHETITAYYVRAVDASDAARPAELLVDSTCSVDAPLRHWSRERLFSETARAAWVEPDRAPLPF